METRTALAEWNHGKLTVWTGTQNPFGYHSELTRAFPLANENVRVVVPDFSCGCGGKEMRFAEGQMRNAVFSRYPVPRLADVPELDIHLLNRPDLESVGSGETLIIAIAPAVANAVFQATGRRIRQMPILLRTAREA